MQAWMAREWCEPEQLAWTRVPVPEPGPGQVRVRVAAAALNFLDTLMVRGRYQERPPLPFTPGVELSGVVDTAGDGASLAPGTRVCGLIRCGALAQYAIADAADLSAVPDDLDLETAAALPVVYGTAHHALTERGRAQPGETLLVLAAAGGVGLAAVQLGKALGLTVLAAAGGTQKLALCRAHGADALFDYREPQWADQVRAHVGSAGVDLVLDPVGADATAAALKVLGFGGRLLIVGFAGGGIPDIPANRLLLKNLAALGVIWGQWRRRFPQAAAQEMAQLFGLWRAGRIAPVVSARYPLAQAPAAIGALGARATTGKVLVLP
jgi:NADPH:quinone reductase